ncbi:MAG TPA: hypothetical protein VJ622_13940 [Acidimicrobiia bacterium]|nr:hypothetical protein [Acidimicrobiia bacterium]
MKTVIGPRAPVRFRRAGRVVDRRRTEQVRYPRMIAMLRLLNRLAFVAALAGLMLPDPVRAAASAVAVGIVVAAPLLRVAWLAIRWYFRGGDRRYAAVAAGLLLVVGAGSVIALVTR